MGIPGRLPSPTIMPWLLPSLTDPFRTPIGPDAYRFTPSAPPLPAGLLRSPQVYLNVDVPLTPALRISPKTAPKDHTVYLSLGEDHRFEYELVGDRRGVGLRRDGGVLFVSWPGRTVVDTFYTVAVTRAGETRVIQPYLAGDFAAPRWEIAIPFAVERCTLELRYARSLEAKPVIIGVAARELRAGPVRGVRKVDPGPQLLERSSVLDIGLGMLPEPLGGMHAGPWASRYYGEGS